MVVHSDLAYPEGVAAAEILKVGSASGSKGGESSDIREIASGGFVAGLVALFTNAFQVLVKSFRSGCMSGAAYTQMPLGYSTALVGLLAIFYAFVSPEQLPAGETLADIKVLLKSRGLGVFIKYLQKAYAIARDDGAELTWDCFRAVCTNFTKLETLKSDY